MAAGDVAVCPPARRCLRLHRVPRPARRTAAAAAGGPVAGRRCGGLLHPEPQLACGTAARSSSPVCCCCSKKNSQGSVVPAVKKKKKGDPLLSVAAGGCAWRSSPPLPTGAATRRQDGGAEAPTRPGTSSLSALSPPPASTRCFLSARLHLSREQRRRKLVRPLIHMFLLTAPFLASPVNLSSSSFLCPAPRSRNGRCTAVGLREGRWSLRG